MSLAPNASLGHYRLVEKLGEGGMGVVWRAHDSTLGRDVAIKVLPDLLAQDPERLARFEREAKLLASLNHPGIAAIYGLHRDGDVRYLVMELVEGETLGRRLERGALPKNEALRIALAIAEALEAAHERGIIHRDLKPANIMIGGDPGADLRPGQVKLLDFGLAKAFEGDGTTESSSASLSRSPTITQAMTSAHVILGTAAYMSPEQARGQAADRRADVWAFGVVLFEMLTGRQLFAGETISDTLAAVLKTEPDWSLLPSDLAPRVRTLLLRCLDRDRRQRLRDIGEARVTLDAELRSAPDTHLDAALRSGVLAVPGAATAVPAAHGARRWLPLAGALALGAAMAFAALGLLAPRRAVDAPLRKLAVGADDDHARMPVISPDGRAVAYLTPTHIVVRELRALEQRRFQHDGAASDLFWSPDGKSVAYIGRSNLYRIDAQSGQQQVVCEATNTFAAGSGGDWSADGVILFSQADEKGMFEVSDRGGDPRPLFATDSTKEGDFHDPHYLPGKRGILFVPHMHRAPLSTIEVWAKGRRKVLVHLEEQTLSGPVYSPTGHILFRRSPTNAGIWAVPFSLDRLEVTGEPFLVAPGGTQPSVANDGTLVYHEGTTASSLRLTWNDREGRETADAGSLVFQGGYTFPTMAPDGQRLCASVHDNDNPDLWVFDARRGTRTRLTFGTGREEFPTWSPSGNAIVYHVRPEGTNSLRDLRVVSIAADGTGRPDTLGIGLCATISADGMHCIYSRWLTSSDWDLVYRPVEGGRTAETVLLRAPGFQYDARVAPGGAFVAYSSDESGADEVFLTRFPSGQGRWQISVGGGQWPRWNRRGDRLWYANGDDIMEVDLTLGASPTLGTPRKLFTRPQTGVPTIVGWSAGFDVTPDGERFAFFRDPPLGGARHEMIVAQNWFSEFHARK